MLDTDTTKYATYDFDKNQFCVKSESIKGKSIWEASLSLLCLLFTLLKILLHTNPNCLSWVVGTVCVLLEKEIYGVILPRLYTSHKNSSQTWKMDLSVECWFLYDSNILSDKSEHQWFQSLVEAFFCCYINKLCVLQAVCVPYLWSLLIKSQCWSMRS